ncbi:MAG: family 20 glycosylhydrolase [Armatimonadetes bacterium]|nr:family 20 glycosylhydrolase [Armatimonadota bacterium]
MTAASRSAWPLLLAACALRSAASEPPIVPRPALLEPRAGSFRLAADVRVLVDRGSAAARGEAEGVAQMLRAAGRPRASVRLVRGGSARPGSVLLTSSGALADLGPEGYSLVAGPRGVVIRARGAAGFFYAGQTLGQMLEGAPAQSALRSVRIVDRPSFGWRGLMVDCSRTFWRRAYLERTIDRLARYKMNVLHLHLTDDQGWRVEIKSHPRLTRVGGRFAERFHEPAERQGYYTQDDIRALVRYAERRHVTLVPELEMPGHCNAAGVAYPDLSCTGGKYEVYPYFTGPGIQTDVFCPGNDRAFAVMEDALDEVMRLFPSKFIHIGGDECPKDRWKACPRCQARMRSEGLKSEEELQSYFVRRIGRFIASRGRRMIGWDEILEGGLAPGAAVMSWRGVTGGVAAARMGHTVVMSPTSHCYFDYGYDAISTRTAYAYEPVPKELTPAQSRLVLGAQANMWTHIARTEPDVDRQLYPRLLALAEATWTPRGRKGWADFSRRLAVQKRRLIALRVPYQTAEGGPSEWPAAKPPLPAAVTSSSGVWTTYTPAFAFDGNPATYYWNDRPIRTGDTVTVTLQQPTRLRLAEVHTGRPGVEIARMHHGVLEVSEDGQAFETVATIADDGVARAALQGRPIRAVRIRATADQGTNWLMARDFVLKAE